MSNQLLFRIHRVKCLDETGGKWVEKLGNDEIYLGGVAVNDRQEVAKISARSIYPHFDDGDVKVFNPPLVFHTFGINQKNGWPKSYGVCLILIEKDAGSMNNEISAIMEKSKESLINYLQSIIQSPIPRPFPRIPDLKSWLPTLKNEVFYPQTATMVLPASNYSWGGTNNSAEKTIRFSDHNGVYELTYDWMLL